MLKFTVLSAAVLMSFSACAKTVAEDKTHDKIACQDAKCVEALVKKANLGAPIASVKKLSDITQSKTLAHLYEVNLGGEIVYVDANAEYLMAGSLFKIEGRVNLTEERKMASIPKVDVKNLPVDLALKEVKGTGERKLYVFTDPDCPFCHKLEKELEKINNATIYRFTFPLPMHANAKNVSASVLCSKNPAEAWNQYMTAAAKGQGKTFAFEAIEKSAMDDCNKKVDKVLEVGQLLGVNGTPALFFEDGTRLPGAAGSDMIEQRMNRK